MCYTDMAFDDLPPKHHPFTKGTRETNGTARSRRKTYRNR